MNGYRENIEQLTLSNRSFRKVLYTAKNCQLVLMCLQPNEDIGEEVHGLDQFFRCESGEGKAILDDHEYVLRDGVVIVVPAGAKHNIINTSTYTPLQLYTVYSPPNHRDGVEHVTKAQAMADEEEFDGKTTE